MDRLQCMQLWGKRGLLMIRGIQLSIQMMEAKRSKSSCSPMGRLLVWMGDSQFSATASQSCTSSTCIYALGRTVSLPSPLHQLLLDRWFHFPAMVLEQPLSLPPLPSDCSSVHTLTWSPLCPLGPAPGQSRCRGTCSSPSQPLPTSSPALVCTRSQKKIEVW